MRYVNLVLGAVLIQCYAARGGHSGCAPLTLTATLGECRALARQYQHEDNRALRVTKLPVVVSYKCQDG